MSYTVRDEPDFEPTYDEDEPVTLRKGDLRALLDVATGSMDYGSGFLDNEQVEALRLIAPLLGIHPDTVTPTNFICQYTGTHNWVQPRPDETGEPWQPKGPWCSHCDLGLLSPNDDGEP